MSYVQDPNIRQELEQLIHPISHVICINRHEHTRTIGKKLVQTNFNNNTYFQLSQIVQDDQDIVVFLGTSFVNKSTKTTKVNEDTATKLNIENVVASSPLRNSSTYNLLEEKYLAELERKGIDKKITDPVFEDLAIELSDINFKKAAVEITKRNSIKLTLSLDDSRLLMISKSLDNNIEGEIEENDIIFSVFLNRQLIVSDSSEIKTLVKGIKKYLTA